MSDTIQTVHWTLAERCQLRQCDDWQDPAALSRVLAYPRCYSDLRASRDKTCGIFGNVCVTGYKMNLEDGPWVYPSSGFLVSEKFPPGTKPETFDGICGNCPANLVSGSIGGCENYFTPWDTFADRPEQIEKIIRQLGLTERFAAEFPKTKNPWFGFWIRSPLSANGVGLLYELYHALLLEKFGGGELSIYLDSDGDPNKLAVFVVALKNARDSGREIHFRLAPPGHADCGFYTVFPHCPRCKYEAPLKRWRRAYPTEPLACPMCGNSYSPASTHSSTRSDSGTESLRKQMSHADFEQLARIFLIAQGASPEEAEKVVTAEEARHKKRVAEGIARGEKYDQHHQYVIQVLFSGLNNVGNPTKISGFWQFTSKDLEEVLRRCAEQKLQIKSITHYSEAGDYSSTTKEEMQSPAEAYARLRREGCNDFFSVNVDVPQETIELWWQNRSNE